MTCPKHAFCVGERGDVPTGEPLEAPHPVLAEHAARAPHLGEIELRQPRRVREARPVEPPVRGVRPRREGVHHRARPDLMAPVVPGRPVVLEPPSVEVLPDPDDLLPIVDGPRHRCRVLPAVHAQVSALRQHGKAALAPVRPRLLRRQNG